MLPGSNVVVLADSLVKFEGPAVALEHGSLRVATSKGLSTHTGDRHGGSRFERLDRI